MRPNDPYAEPITARLRVVPMDEWTAAELDEERAAVEARLAENIRIASADLSQPRTS